MTANSQSLVQLASDLRAADKLQVDEATLTKIRDFFWRHEADNARNATHVVLENYPDWWVRGRRAPPGLIIEEAEDLKTLQTYVGKLFHLRIPMTLAERRTATFRFFQDIEIWGTKDVCLSIDDLIGPECGLTTTIGNILHEVFPTHEFLDATVYDATGLSQTKGVKKTSIRLVWPALCVDVDRAMRTRDFIVHHLTVKTGAIRESETISKIDAQLREISPANMWHSVFDDAAYGTRATIRMPLCDRVSPLPLRAPERRPFAPVGVLRFAFGKNIDMRVEWLCRQADLQESEWVQIGCIRQPVDTPLAEWGIPSTAAPQQSYPTRSGRVKVRTAGGSEGGGGVHLRASRTCGGAYRTSTVPDRAGQQLVVERAFSGTVDEFRDRMSQQFGSGCLETDGCFVWKLLGGDARMVLCAEEKRVKVVGRQSQVRTLVMQISPFTEAKPAPRSDRGLNTVVEQGFFCTVEESRDRVSQHLGSRPSAAFAPVNKISRPSAAYAPVSKVLSTEVHKATKGVNQIEESAEVPLSTVGQRRIVRQDFEAQGQTELNLSCFEAVHITNDPQDGGDDRWVFGENEATGRCGWFPLSHTSLQSE